MDSVAITGQLYLYKVHIFSVYSYRLCPWYATHSFFFCIGYVCLESDTDFLWWSICLDKRIQIFLRAHRTCFCCPVPTRVMPFQVFNQRRRMDNATSRLVYAVTFVTVRAWVQLIKSESITSLKLPLPSHSWTVPRLDTAADDYHWQLATPTLGANWVFLPAGPTPGISHWGVQRKSSASSE